MRGGRSSRFLAIAMAMLGVSAMAHQPPPQPPAAGTTLSAAPMRIYIRSGLKM